MRKRRVTEDGGVKKPGHFYDEVWRQNYYFHVGWSEEMFYSYWSFQARPPLKDGYCIELNQKNGNGIIIWIRKMPKKKMIGVLAHECVHAALWCLKARGFVLDYDNDEPLTYLVEAIMRKALP